MSKIQIEAIAHQETFQPEGKTYKVHTFECAGRVDGEPRERFTVKTFPPKPQK